MFNKICKMCCCWCLFACVLLCCKGQPVALAGTPAELFKVVINEHFNAWCDWDCVWGNKSNQTVFLTAFYSKMCVVTRFSKYNVFSLKKKKRKLTKFIVFHLSSFFFCFFLLHADGKMWWQRPWVSLSLPLLQSLPLALLRGQTAHQLLHLPLPLRISENKEKTIEICSLESCPKAKEADSESNDVATSSPAHDLLQLLAGQEARVLPDLPQGALVLPLELVLEALPLLLLPGVATLLPIVQPAGGEKRLQWAELFGPPSIQTDSRCCLYLHLHRLGREELQRNRLLLVEHQTRVRRGSVTNGLQDLPVEVLHREELDHQQHTRDTQTQYG